MKLSCVATCLILIAVIATTSACSQMVANSGIASVAEIEDRRRRDEVRAQYGNPVSSTTLPSGREVEIYRIRKQLDTVYAVLSNSSWVSRQKMTGSEVGKWALLCALFGPGCLYIATATVVNETFSLPVNLVRSQMNQMEVAFVFGNDNELLYVYEADADPAAKFSRAIATLQHPLRSEGDGENTTVGERLAEYIAEARQRAEEVGHSLSEQDEQSLEQDLQTAESIDAGIITKKEALEMRPSQFLATSSP